VPPHTTHRLTVGARCSQATSQGRSLVACSRQAGSGSAVRVAEPWTSLEDGTLTEAPPERRRARYSR